MKNIQSHSVHRQGQGRCKTLETTGFNVKDLQEIQQIHAKDIQDIQQNHNVQDITLQYNTDMENQMETATERINYRNVETAGGDSTCKPVTKMKKTDYMMQRFNQDEFHEGTHVTINDINTIHRMNKGQVN